MMNITNVIRELNKLKQRKILKDYALFGAVASSYYMYPVFTDDIDVIVLADTDSDYIKIWNELKLKSEKIVDFTFIIKGTKLQIFPTSVSPLYKDAITNAQKVKVDNLVTKIALKEHLIMLFLTANRGKDQYKAKILLETANVKYLNNLLRRFDNGTIAQRIKALQSSHT